MPLESEHGATLLIGGLHHATPLNHLSGLLVFNSESHFPAVEIVGAEVVAIDAVLNGPPLFFHPFGKRVVDRHFSDLIVVEASLLAFQLEHGRPGRIRVGFKKTSLLHQLPGFRILG